MKGPEMLKYLLAAAALLVAGVPAYLGLTSNASFSRDVPVRVPEQAQVVTPSRATAPTRTPTPTRATNDDGTPDQGRGEAEPGDDHGGEVPRATRTEAGDDRDSHAGRDDSGRGSDDGSGHH